MCLASQRLQPTLLQGSAGLTSIMISLQLCHLYVVALRGQPGPTESRNVKHHRHDADVALLLFCDANYSWRMSQFGTVKHHACTERTKQGEHSNPTLSLILVCMLCVMTRWHKKPASRHMYTAAGHEEKCHTACAFPRNTTCHYHYPSITALALVHQYQCTDD